MKYLLILLFAITSISYAQTIDGKPYGTLQVYTTDIATELTALKQEVSRLEQSIANQNVIIQARETEIALLKAKIVSLEQQLAECDTTTPPSTPVEMYFNKDFEGVTLVNKSNNTGKNFVNWGLNELTICNASLNFVSGNVTSTPCEMVADPAGTGRRVLYMSVLDDDAAWSGTSRAQLDLSLDASIRNSTVYHMSHRMYLHPDLAHLANNPGLNASWFTLHEIWNEGGSGYNPAGSGRWTVYVKKNSANKLYLRAEAQYTPSGQQIDLWEVNNENFVIPFGKWFTWDIYVKRGLGSEGQYKIVITVDGEQPVTVFDIRNHTILPQAPNLRMSYFAPFKLYGGDGPIYDWMRSQSKKIAAYYNDFKWYKQ